MRGDRLRESRESHGWSQRELAELCDLGENQIYRYENEISDPSATALKVIAEKLGVTTDYLLGLTNEPQSSASDRELTDNERDILDKFRREGWVGLIRLGADRVEEILPDS